MATAKKSEVASRDPNAPVPTSPLVGIAAGLVACLVILAIDMGVLELARYQDWTGISVILVFAVFIVQTAILGYVVGSKVNHYPLWWLFFGWMLVLVNLVLILVRFNSYAWDRAYQSAFVFAFLTAQIGLVLFWGILGASDWRRRVPFAFSLLAVASYPYWFGGIAHRNWLGVTTCYIVSVAVACAVLRLWRFQLGSKEQWSGAVRSGRMDQFGIKHLFIWMTIVAFLFGVGRFVPWSYVATALVNQSMISLFLRALLMTVIMVATAWAVLGDRRGAWLRMLVFVGVLILIGFALAFVEQRQMLTRRWSSLVGWQNTNWEIRKIWLVWTTLNGLFLAGLMLVIRMSGARLVRSKNAKPKG